MSFQLTPLTAGLLLINAITFAVYGYDKFCAKRGAWRVPEIRLLGLAALGGQCGGSFGHVPVPAQDEASEIHHRGAGDPGTAGFCGGQGVGVKQFPLAKRQIVKYNRAWENLSVP